MLLGNGRENGTEMDRFENSFGEEPERAPKFVPVLLDGNWVPFPGMWKKLP